MSIFSWIEPHIEDFLAMLRDTQNNLDNEALSKLQDGKNQLPEVWTEDGAPPPEYATELEELVKDAEYMVELVDKLQASIENASTIVREGDKKIKSKVDGLDDLIKSI